MMFISERVNTWRWCEILKVRPTNCTQAKSVFKYQFLTRKKDNDDNIITWNMFTISINKNPTRIRSYGYLRIRPAH